MKELVRCISLFEAFRFCSLYVYIYVSFHLPLQSLARRIIPRENFGESVWRALIHKGRALAQAIRSVRNLAFNGRDLYYQFASNEWRARRLIERSEGARKRQRIVANGRENVCAYFLAVSGTLTNAGV